MVLSGLWHGAGWTFVAWGGLQGAGLVVNLLWRRSGMRLPALAGWFLTFLFFCATMVICRSASLEHAATVLASMAGLEGSSSALDLSLAAWRPSLFGSQEADAVAWIAVGMAVALLGVRSQDLALHHLRPSPWPAAVAGLVAAGCAVIVGESGGAEFIYFQF